MTDLEKYIKENEPVYFHEVKELLTHYIEGPKDKNGKYFEFGRNVNVPCQGTSANLYGCYYSFNTQNWYIQTGSGEILCSICTMQEPDTLEKIREDAATLNSTTYAKKHNKGDYFGLDEMKLDLIRRTEEVVRNEI